MGTHEAASSAWISIADLAKELGIPTGTIYNWRYKGEAPRGYKLGRSVRFRRRDVEEWLESRSDAG